MTIATSERTQEPSMLDILFVQNYYEQMLGIMQISSLLKTHDFTTDVAIGTQAKILNKALRDKPKIVGFYCTTGFHHKNIAVAAEIKKRFGNEILTIFGGPHPTFVPGMIEAEGVDIICRGEGEYPVLELLQAIHSGNDYTAIDNLTVKLDGEIYENPLRSLCDVNSLPYPDRSIYRDIKYIYEAKRHEVMIGRGCPFNCTFCSAPSFRKLYRGKGNYMRVRAISHVLDELKQIKNKYRPTCFFFHDDTFGFNKDYEVEFLTAYKKQVDLPFACLIRADLASEGYIKLLKETGCYMVSFGIESGNEALRKKVLKKQIGDEHILQCAALLHQYKIPFNTFNMVGLPDETLTHVWDTIDINIQVKPNWAWFSTYQTLPQTELARYAVAHGHLVNIDVAQADASFHESSEILRNNPEAFKISRLRNCANIVIKLPFLKKIFKKTILKLPFDGFFNALEKFLYFIFYYSKLTYKERLLDSIKDALFLTRRLKEFK